MSEQVRTDVEHTDTLTEVIKGLLNSYPELKGEFSFATLEDKNSKAFYSDSGALILRERESITGYVVQECVYPFVVMMRSGGTREKRKIFIKDLLDNIGRYLEGQPITIEDTTYTMDKPELEDPMEFKKIERTTNSYMLEPNSDNTEDWVINIQLHYNNNFWR